jgi:isocitrate dehydrogenase kinase/phosphatase
VGDPLRLLFHPALRRPPTGYREGGRRLSGPRGTLGTRNLEEVRIDVLESPFYRNKAAYLIGRVIQGEECQPFVIPLVNNEEGAIYADTLLTQAGAG